jgi:hypothetical protein
MTGIETEREALARLGALLDAYGAAPHRWPEDRRAWAEALIARSAEARALAGEAARLDALIAAAMPEPAPAHLVGRVIAAAPAARARRGWLAEMMKPALGLACAAVLGVALGLVVSPFAPVNGELAEADAVALDLGVLVETDL